MIIMHVNNDDNTDNNDDNVKIKTLLNLWRVSRKGIPE